MNEEDEIVLYIEGYVSNDGSGLSNQASVNSFCIGNVGTFYSSTLAFSRFCTYVFFTVIIHRILLLRDVLFKNHWLLIMLL